MRRVQPAGLIAVSALSIAAFAAADVLFASLVAAGGDPIKNLVTGDYSILEYLQAGGPIFSFEAGPLAAGLAVSCGVWVVWAYALMRQGNYRHGEEHGSARWAEPTELRRFSDAKSPDGNILLTRSVALAMARADHDPRWERNRNVCVIGGSGAGKTRGYVLPNLLQMNASYLVTDTKNTLLPLVGGAMEQAGYAIRTFNTVDFSLSMRYNPIAYVRSQKDILELVECLIVNTTPKGRATGDPFWENSERLLYTALVAYLVYHCPEEDRTLPGLMTLLSLAEAREEDEGFMSPLDVLFRELETGTVCVRRGGESGAGDGRALSGAASTVAWNEVADPLSPEADFALSRYKAFKVAAGKTLKSIIISCNARLSALEAAEVKELLSADDMALDTLGDPGQRAAIFATMSDTNATFSFLFAMLMWQAANVLCEKAIRDYAGELPTPVHLLLDEFANIERLPDIERTIAVVRSRNIGISIVLQSMAQLKSRYEADAETIVDCCDTLLFLGGKSNSTNEEIAKAVGKETVSTRTFNESRGTSSGTTSNYQIAERDLIQAAEVGKLDRRRAIVLIAGCDPALDEKYAPERHPRWGELGGRFDIAELVGRSRDVGLMRCHLAAAPLTGFDLDDSELEFLAAAGEAFLRKSDNPGE